MAFDWRLCNCVPIFPKSNHAPVDVHNAVAPPKQSKLLRTGLARRCWFPDLEVVLCRRLPELAYPRPLSVKTFSRTGLDHPPGILAPLPSKGRRADRVAIPLRCLI